jgi:predicted phage tail protein
MRKVKLLGELGKKFGRVFKLDVKTPAEAIRALCVNIPGFEQHLVQSQQRNVGYRVIQGKDELDENGLLLPLGRQDLKIVPVVMGSGRIGRILVGGALLFAATFNPLGFFGGTALLTGTAATIATYVGTALVIGGVSELLFPPPKTPSLQDRPDNKPSYVFNGAVNTTAQGYPVPVGYGRMIVGSAVISAAITAEDLPI